MDNTPGTAPVTPVNFLWTSSRVGLRLAVDVSRRSPSTRFDLFPAPPRPMKDSSGKPLIALAMEYPLHQQGGVEVLMREMVRGLAGRFEVVLVSGDPNREALGEEFSSLVAAHFSWNKAAASRQVAHQLAAAMASHQIKLAHFHSGGVYGWESHKAWQSPILHLTGAGVPCLVTSHSTSPLLEGFSHPGRPAWQKALLLPKAWTSKAMLISRVQTEILVSKHDRARLQRFFSPFAGKLQQMYHSKLTRTDGGLPSKQRKKIVFCLGTLCESKGQAILIRAFASVAKRHLEWSLHLMGRHEPPDYRDELEKLAARLGISERVQISPPQNDPSPVLASASIFALPSLLEGLGLSLQEALYYGCACVGSNVGGIPELIEDEVTGLLAPPKDVVALAAALDRLMSEPELRQRLSQQARQTIVEKGMLSTIMLGQYIQLYEAILAGREAAWIH